MRKWFRILSLLSVAGVTAAHAEPGHAQNPVWSEDGMYLAYETNNLSDRTGVWIAKANPGEEVVGRPIEDPARDPGPFAPGSRSLHGWSPEGELIVRSNMPKGAFTTVSALGSDTHTFEIQPWPSPPDFSADGNFALVVCPSAGVWLRDLDKPASVSLNDLWQRVCPPRGGQQRVHGHQPTIDDLHKAIVADGAPFTRLADVEGAAMARWSRDEDTVYIQTRPKSAAGRPETQISAIDVNTGVAKPVANGHRPAAILDGVAFFASGSPIQTDLVTVVDGIEHTIATDVRLPHRAPPAVTPDGKWLAYTSQNSSSLNLTTATGSSTVEIPTPHKSLGEPALTDRNGRILLAYTALEREDCERRRLFVIDITEKL